MKGDEKLLLEKEFEEGAVELLQIDSM